jgi:hypothetical protein
MPTTPTAGSFRTPDGVTIGVEQFGDPAAPLVMLAGAPTLLSWPDALCAALAREIPGARLLVLERAGTAIPEAAVDEVAAAMLALQPGYRGSADRSHEPFESSTSSSSWNRRSELRCPTLTMTRSGSSSRSSV